MEQARDFKSHKRTLFFLIQKAIFNKQNHGVIGDAKHVLASMKTVDGCGHGTGSLDCQARELRPLA